MSCVYFHLYNLLIPICNLVHRRNTLTDTELASKFQTLNSYFKLLKSPSLLHLGSTELKKCTV